MHTTNLSLSVWNEEILVQKHIWQRIQQPSKRRALANNLHKRKPWTLWKKCWTDAQETLKHERILLLQRYMEETLAQLEDSSNNGGQEASCPGLIRDSTAETTTEAQPTSAGLLHDSTTQATTEAHLTQIIQQQPRMRNPHLTEII